MEEPSIPELIRDCQAGIDDIRSRFDTLVTRELYEERHASLEKRVADLETRAARWWTTVIGPVIVGVMLYVLGVAK